MEYISSDTNVWIDFNIISRMNLPFLLPYTYIMYTESMESELLNPEGFKDQLAEAGLVGVDITIEEFLLAQSWGPLYPKLSIQDRIALAHCKAARYYPSDRRQSTSHGSRPRRRTCDRNTWYSRSAL